MKSYLAIFLIGLISCNTLVTDSSKIEFSRLLKENESHLKDKIAYFIHIIVTIIKYIWNFQHIILKQEYYKIFIEKVKTALNDLKEYLKKHSIKEISEKFISLVKQYQDYIRKISSKEIAEVIVDIVKKIKDIVLKTDFGTFEYILKELKDKFRNFDEKKYGKEIEEKIERKKINRRF